MDKEDFLARAAAMTGGEPATKPPVHLEVAPEPPTKVAPEASRGDGGSGPSSPCEHEVPEGAKFCPSCGASQATSVQWRCGHDNPDEAKFCAECGMPAFSAPVTESFTAVVASRAEGFRPKPEKELTREERDERMRAHAEAVRMGQRDAPPGPPERPQPGQELQTIHMMEDGMSFAGVVWMRGQEISLPVGSPRWEQAQDWINMTDFQQMERWGKVMFRPGHWPGRPVTEALAAGPEQPMLAPDGKTPLPPPDPAAFQRAAQLEAQRAGAVPSAVV